MALENFEYEELWWNLERYIKENYIAEKICACCANYVDYGDYAECAIEEPALKEVESLAELLHREELTFSDKLFELIDAKELDEVEVYTAASLDRRLFSKLRRKDYQPSKNTVLALIIGMRLSMVEAKELLEYAGYALAPSNKTDIIISFFLESKGNYDIDLVNRALYKHGQKLLGNVLA